MKQMMRSNSRDSAINEHGEKYLHLRNALEGSDFCIEGDEVFFNTDKSSRAVCSAFELLGLARHQGGTWWGIALQVRDPDGNLKNVILSQASLQAEPRTVRADLARVGLQIRRSGDMEELLTILRPSKRILLVPQPGWHGDVFVTPDGSAVGSIGEEVVQLDNPLTAQVSGTLENQIAGLRAAFESGVDHFALAVLAGVAGCLCGRIGHETSPILALVGETSKGKTTGLKIAAGVFGDPKPGLGRLHTLRSTSNAVEVLATRSNGSFLGLDEAANMPNEEVQGLVFMLAGGRPKGRQTKAGSLRDSHGWCTFVMLSSEQGIAEKIAAGRSPMMNGATVRCLEVDVSDAPAAPASIMDAIKALDSNFGHVGPLAAKLLTEELPNQIQGRIDGYVTDLVGAEADPLKRRSAAVLGLLREAGELLKRVGVLDEASDVRGLVGRVWEAYRSSSEADRLSPNEKAVNTLREALMREIGRTVIPVDDTDRIVHAPAAWYQDKNGFRTFYVPVDTLVRLSGSGVRDVSLKKELKRLGILSASGRNLMHSQLPGGRQIRHFRLNFGQATAD